VRETSASEQFLLGRRELFRRQHARLVKLSKLLELGCHIICRRRRGRRGRRCILLRGWGCILLLLCLCIVSALLVRLVICCLLLRFFIRPMLVLGMVYSACCTSDNGCANRGTSY